MPNYNITIDSKFDPYSFEDYLKPAMLMQEQHNQAADAYATALANSAGLYDALKVNAEDAEAAKYVNDYENSLNALASDLATNGLNRNNRRGVYETKAKTGYIEKLKKAIDNRNTFIAQQNELALNDPTRRFSDYASNHGITRFLNPDFTYGSFSGAAIQKQTEDLIKNYAESAYIQDPNNPQYKHFSGLTYMIQQKTGATPEQIQKAMDLVRNGVDINSMSENDKNIVTQLAEAANQVVTEHLGDYEWGEDNLTYARESAAEGLRKALGSYSIKPFNVEEPKVTGSGSGKTLADVPWIYKDMLTPGGVKLRGRDNKQIQMANEISKAIKTNGKKPDYKIGQTQYMNNIVDYAKNNLSEDGVLSEENKKLALATINKSFDSVHGIIPSDLIPEKDRLAYKAKALALFADIGIGGAEAVAIVNAGGPLAAISEVIRTKLGNSDFGGAPAVKADYEALVKMNREILNNAGVKDIEDSKINDFVNGYTNYVNKGAVRTEGAFFTALSDTDSEQTFKNIVDLTSNAPYKAHKFKGQNISGDYVNSLDTPTDEEDYSETLYNDNGKWNSLNSMGITMDNNGNVVAVVNGKDGAYQFDITKGLYENHKDVYDLSQDYRTAKRALKEVEDKITNSKVFQKWQQEQEERKALEQLAQMSPKVAAWLEQNGNPTKLTLEEQKEVGRLLEELNDKTNTAQKAGTKTYNALYSVLAKKQALVDYNPETVKMING